MKFYKDFCADKEKTKEENKEKSALPDKDFYLIDAIYKLIHAIRSPDG